MNKNSVKLHTIHGKYTLFTEIKHYSWNIHNAFSDQKASTPVQVIAKYTNNIIQIQAV